jgi:hypothetical protein
VIEGRVESVGDESGSLLNERQRLGRRKKAGRPREKHGKVEKVAEQRVPVVADLKRLDGAGAFMLTAGNGRRALHASPGKDLQSQERHEHGRHHRSENRAHPTTVCAVPTRGIFH